MLTLILASGIAVIVSFTCSLAEAVLYALPWSAIERMRRSGSRAGDRLFKLRSAVDKPIAAILTLNTTANTAGSSLAGAAFLVAFGGEYMPLFALVFTVLILTLGEILPKTLGVAFAPRIAPHLARPLEIAVACLGPVIWLTGRFTRLVTPASEGPKISEDDIRALTSLSRQAGQIQPYEERFVRNVLALDQKRVKDIMTPRTVVFSLPDDMTVEDAYNVPDIWHFSRIPVYGEDNEDLVGVVEHRALERSYRDGRRDVRLGALMRPVHFILENQTLDVLLKELLTSRTHLFAVLDEYAGLSGVVTLEDVLEEILGSEIVDESDSVADLRALAKQRRMSVSGRSS
jgi:CBS domain containing-hemolysin-like protein